MSAPERRCCAEYSAFDCAADGNTCYCGDKDGDLRVLDLRAKDGQAAPVRPCTASTLSPMQPERTVALMPFRCEWSGRTHITLWLANHTLRTHCSGLNCRAPFCSPAVSNGRVVEPASPRFPWSHLGGSAHRLLAKPIRMPQAVGLHDKKVNTLHLEPGAERELASSCSDGSVAVWDVRKLASGGAVQPIATAGHSFTCQSAYFAPNGACSLALRFTSISHILTDASTKSPAASRPQPNFLHFVLR